MFRVQLRELCLSTDASSHFHTFGKSVVALGPCTIRHSGANPDIKESQSARSSACLVGFGRALTLILSTVFLNSLALLLLTVCCADLTRALSGCWCV